MRIGFIGLGAMGRPMAASLQRAGHALQVYDVRSVEGFSMKSSAAEAAKGCELLFTSLPGPAEVEAVAAHLTSALVWFDLSTNSPKVVRTLHAELRKKGIEFLDAPVSGGPKGAQSGKLAIWVGGERGGFQEIRARTAADRRSTLLRRTDRRRHRGEARAQRRQLHRSRRRSPRCSRSA